MRVAVDSTRNRALIICGIVVVLGIVFITSSRNLQRESDHTGNYIGGGGMGAARRRRKLGSSELLTHLSRTHHSPLASENSKASQQALDAASQIITPMKKGEGEEVGGVVSQKGGGTAISSSPSSPPISAVNKMNQQPDSFARQRIRIALVNAHKDLSNFNQGITIADIKRFHYTRNQKEVSSLNLLEEDGNMQKNKKKKDVITTLKENKKRKVSAPSSTVEQESQGLLPLHSQEVLRQFPWQEAYMFARAMARPNITLPSHTTTVLQRALDLDAALAKREKANKPLIHQAIEDSDKTRFGDAPEKLSPKNIDGFISSGGDAVSGSGEIVIPGGILRDDTIFVTIASYRDSECAPTILDLYSKARYPRALTVGIAVQHDHEEDPSCIPKEFLTSNEHCQNTYGFCPTDNIRTRVVSHRDAKGPTFGRYLGMLLYRGERYIFMMDSHNRFVTHWDFIIVNMYKRLEAGDFGSYDDEQHDAEARKIFSYPETGSVYRYVGNEGDGIKKLDPVDSNQHHLLPQPNSHNPSAAASSAPSSKRRAAGKFGITKPVLSHYPEAWFHPGEADTGTNRPLDRRHTTTYMCRGKFLEWGVFRLDGNVVAKPARPLPQGWAAAGFLFARGEILAEVPFDPYLDYVFDGEEITYSIRMWTHGWDIFSPNENILYHYYGRKKAKRFWEVVPANWTARKIQGEKRIQHLLHAVPKGSSEPPLKHVPISAPSGQQQHHHAAEVEVITADLLLQNSTNSAQESTMTITLEEFTKAATSTPWAREIERYGLGAERPLSAYYSYAGLTPSTREFKEGWFCSRKH